MNRDDEPEFWTAPLAERFAGRDVILVGAVPAAWHDHVRHLTAAGVRRFLVVATEGAGVGPGPDVETVVVEPDAAAGGGMMERIRRSNALIGDPPRHVVAAADRFDPDGTAIVIGTFLAEAATFAGRPLLAHRRPEWVRLEDKTLADEIWERAGVEHQPSTVVPLSDAEHASRSLDRGHGTVWAADASEGYHGGGHLTRWVRDAATLRRAQAQLGGHCDVVRVMPFVEGTPCSIHAIVLPDGDAVFRPVEMVTLRNAAGLVYAGCATFWDPPVTIREQMRSAARRVARVLRAEADFRGTFTIDGVAAPDGFWPTELNPRFGAGINTLTRAVGDIPILLLHDLAVAGLSIGADAATLEQTVITAADARRGGGTWLVDHSTIDCGTRPVAYDGASWRWAETDVPADGTLISGPNFARCTFDPDRTPVGPSVSGRAAAFWNFAAPHIGSDTGPLTPSIPVE